MKFCRRGQLLQFYKLMKNYDSGYTVNVDIFALYICSRNSRFLNMCENMYTSKITFVIAYRANYT